jgi:hypothetical protein
MVTFVIARSGGVSGAPPGSRPTVPVAEGLSADEFGGGDTPIDIWPR